MPGSMPATSQLDWLISTTVMIVLSWSRATRDLLKSFGWGIRALHQLATATMVPSPRRLPHTISPLEEDGFKLAVSSCETGLPGRAGMNAGSMSCAAPLSAGRPTREATAGPLAAAPGVRISLAPRESLRTLGPPRDERPDWAVRPRFRCRRRVPEATMAGKPERASTKTAGA